MAHFTLGAILAAQRAVSSRLSHSYFWGPEIRKERDIQKPERVPLEYANYSEMQTCLSLDTGQSELPGSLAIAPPSPHKTKSPPEIPSELPGVVGR